MSGSAGQPTGSGREPNAGDQRVPEPQGHLIGVPFDWRTPNAARSEARWWNPHDRRLFTPKSFGWGYVVNLYWVAHPVRYLTGGS